MDNELEQVFMDINSLPTIVTPVGDPEGALCMTPAEYPVIVAPSVSSCVIQPLLASSPAGPDVRSPGFSHPSTGSVGDLLGNRSSPVVSAPEGLPHSSDLNQAQPEAGLSFTGDLAGGLFPAIPLTPVPSGGPDLSCEVPFDIHQDNPCSAASPQLLPDIQRCPFRTTSS